MAPPDPPPPPDSPPAGDTSADGAADAAAGAETATADQLASRAPVPDAPLAPDETVSVTFPHGAVALPETARHSLDRVVAALAGNTRTKATVRAYADGGGDPNKARRTSLSRALAVRAYLIDKGVESARIDVRALGDQYGGGAPERVDVVTSER